MGWMWFGLGNGTKKRGRNKRLTIAGRWHFVTLFVVLLSLAGEVIHVVRGPALVDDANVAVRLVRFF